MSTPYKVLFDGVITMLRSTGIPNITEDEFDEILMGHVRPACVRFRACKQDLNKRNDTLATFEIELIDEEIEILINFLYIEFISANYINVPSLLRQSLVSRDYHAFSSANHLKGLMDLWDTTQKETRQMISIYSNMGLELFGKLKTMREESLPPIEDEEGSD